MNGAPPLHVSPKLLESPDDLPQAVQVQPERIPEPAAALPSLPLNDSKAPADEGTILGFMKSLPRARVDASPDPQAMVMARRRQEGKLEWPSESSMEARFRLVAFGLDDISALAHDILDEACDALRATEDKVDRRLQRLKERWPKDGKTGNAKEMPVWIRGASASDEPENVAARLNGVADGEKLQVSCFCADGEKPWHMELHQIYEDLEVPSYDPPFSKVLDLASELRFDHERAEELLRQREGFEWDEPVAIAHEALVEKCERFNLRLHKVHSAEQRILLCEAAGEIPGFEFPKRLEGRRVFYEIPSSLLTRRGDAPRHVVLRDLVARVESRLASEQPFDGKASARSVDAAGFASPLDERVALAHRVPLCHRRILFGACKAVRHASLHLVQMFAGGARSTSNGNWKVPAHVICAADGQKLEIVSRVTVIGIDSAELAMVTCISGTEVPGHEGREAVHDNQACFKYSIFAQALSYPDEESIKPRSARDLFEAIVDVNSKALEATDQLLIMKGQEFSFPAALANRELDLANRELDEDLFHKAEFRVTNIVSADYLRLECAANRRLKKFEKNGLLTLVAQADDYVLYHVNAEHLCSREPIEPLEDSPATQASAGSVTGRLRRRASV